MSDALPADALARAALRLARRFEAGATMWCVSPAWPSHGRHVAVEFVHPVIVGKRALPAVHVDDEDIAATLRLLTRAGDILVAIGPASARIEDLMRRAQAWGLTTLRLGAGPRPTTVTGDHVIWAGEAGEEQALHAGEMVILYHLLWELTHVVFEHPGLLTEPAGGDDDVCITCSDEGRIAEVIAVMPSGQAEVMAEGRRETVDVSLVDPVRNGDLLLVHAGTALTRLEGS